MTQVAVVGQIKVREGGKSYLNKSIRKRPAEKTSARSRATGQKEGGKGHQEKDQQGKSSKRKGDPLGGGERGKRGGAGDLLQ